MKMAERQNILAMGLDPDQVISFGGGWVNHEAPEEFRQAYVEVASDPVLFHKSGGYTATLGELECREQIARFEAALFGVPRLGPEHVAIGMGSTQLTHDLFRVLVNPGDAVLLLDPTYANYEGQLAFATPGVSIVRLRVVDPATGHICRRATPKASREGSGSYSTCTSPGWCCSARPTTRPARSCPRRSRKRCSNARRTPARGWPSTSRTSASTSRRTRPTTRGRRPITRTSSAFIPTRNGRAGSDDDWAGSRRRPPSWTRWSACSSAASSAPTLWSR